jgi:hypothetical protein
MQELSSLTETATQPRMMQIPAGFAKASGWIKPLPCAAESQVVFSKDFITAWHGLRRISSKSS